MSPAPRTPTFWIFMRFRIEPRSRQRLDDHGDPLSSADAGGGDAVAEVAPPQFFQERERAPRAGRGERMPEGDGAAVDVQLLPVEAELADDAEDLSRERLVDLPEIDVLDPEIGARERGARRGSGAEAHQLRIAPDDGGGDEPAERLGPLVAGVGGGRDDDGRGRVHDPRG